MSPGASPTNLGELLAPILEIPVLQNSEFSSIWSPIRTIFGSFQTATVEDSNVQFQVMFKFTFNFMFKFKFKLETEYKFQFKFEPKKFPYDEGRPP